MKLEQFLAVHKARSERLMWLLGAGASASAGVQTAWDIIWDCKRTIYSIRNKVPIKALSDLGNPSVRAKIQQFLDSQGQFPKEGAHEEYSVYFEQVHPSDADRRAYIDRLVAAGSPSYGHIALAILMKLGKVKAVWTTNFDRVIEDAAFAVFGSSKDLVVATLDKAKLASEALSEERFPILGKIHGDFQSRRLKNTSSELQAQDADLRTGLVEACQKFGLIVMGYSGRDQSVMDTLAAAINSGKGFPAGLFWCHRSDSPPTSEATQLLVKARESGIEAEFVEVETFDECLADIINLVENIPQQLWEHLASKARRLTDAPPIEGGLSYPLVRLNALPVLSVPTTCRRIVCDIGGTGDVHRAIKASAANVVACRRNVGVLAFGSDEEVRKVFAPFKIMGFDLHSVEPGRLRFDSAELGLFYTAFGKALQRQLPLTYLKKHNRHMVFVDEARDKNHQFGELRAAVGAFSGVVSGTQVKWAEAATIKFEAFGERLWLVLEPCIWSDLNRGVPAEQAQSAKEFVRSRMAGRFNQQWNRIFDAWIRGIFGSSKDGEFRTFGIADGVDASFKILSASGYSPRQGVQV